MKPKTKLLTILLIAGFASNAQQPLNLDFEKKSYTDKTLPWGWEKGMNDTQVQIKLDSVHKISGNYGLKFDADSIATMLSTLNFWVDSKYITNKTIVLTGSLKVEKGSPEVWIKLEDWGGDAMKGYQLIKADSVKPITGSGQILFKLELPKNSKREFINICLGFKGQGEVWFDQLEIAINNKKVNEVEVARAFTNKQMMWISKNTFVLKGFDAGLPDEDLKTFEKLAGNAKIIALGESTHGTGDFFKMKHRILEYAIKHMNVRVFAIEDNQLNAELINNYVKGIGKWELYQLMPGMFGVWYRQEVIDMIEWIKAYNVSHTNDMVEFVGFDIQNINLAFDSLSTFLGKHDTETGIRSVQMLQDFKTNWMNGYSVSDSVRHKWYTVTKQHFALIEGKKDKWLKQAKNGKDSLKVQWAIQYSRLIYQNACSGFLGYRSLYRDSAMAQNIRWITEMHKPQTRYIVWAHDTHISKGQHPIAEYNYYNGISMGSWLARYFKTNYKAFGLSTFEGSYLALPSYFNYWDLINCESHAAPRGSLDEALHTISGQKKSGFLLLDLQKGREKKWLNELRPVRMGNHVCIEYPYGAKHAIPYQFDGLIFMDKTEGSTLVK